MKSQAMISAKADGGFDFIQNACILDFIGLCPISSFAEQKISLKQFFPKSRKKPIKAG